MRILITGGAGFIGTNLVNKLLNDGHEVKSLDIAPTKVPEHHQITENIDICNRDNLLSFFSRFKPEYVVHLAARTDLDEKYDLNGYVANIGGVRNLVEAVKNCGSVKRVVYTSTQLVCRIGYLPVNSADYCPNTLYGKSKVLGERIVKELDGGGCEWTIIRPTTVWGPWMKLYQERFFELIEQGRYFHIGTFDKFKSYAYVGNFCHQIFALLLADSKLVHQKTFYLADYEPLSLKKWANAIQEEFRSPKINAIPFVIASVGAKVGDLLTSIGVKNFPLTSFRLRNICTEYVYNLDAIREIVPTLPYSMPKAVHETVAWFHSRHIEVNIVKDAAK